MKVIVRICSLALFFLSGCIVTPKHPITPRVIPSPIDERAVEVITVVVVATPIPPMPTQVPAATPASLSTNLPPSFAVCSVDKTGGDTLNVRKAPSMSAEIIGGLLPHARIAVLGMDGDWLRVKFGKVTGFVYSEYCEVNYE